jgi:hypothetical protein
MSIVPKSRIARKLEFYRPPIGKDKALLVTCFRLPNNLLTMILVNARFVFADFLMSVQSIN